MLELQLYRLSGIGIAKQLRILLVRLSVVSQISLILKNVYREVIVSYEVVGKIGIIREDVHFSVRDGQISFQYGIGVLNLYQHIVRKHIACHRTICTFEHIESDFVSI